MEEDSENITVTIKKSQLKKLTKMMISGEAANLSHAVRLCIQSYQVKEVKKV